jgi:hypothetical protein
LATTPTATLHDRGALKSAAGFLLEISGASRRPELPDEL